MEQRTARIFVSCSAGAAIGGLCALQWGMWWWLGILVGGATGYLGYELPEVYQAMKKVKRENVFKNIKMASNVVSFLVSIGLLFATVLVTVTAPAIVMQLQRVSVVTMDTKLTWYEATSFLGLLLFVAVNLFLVFPEQPKGKYAIYKVLLAVSPPMIWCYYPVKYIYRGIKFLPTVFKEILHVLVAILVLIHSELRVLCMVDAGIGATVGFFSGSVVIGALAGGILGVINFEIISKRLLKIAK